MKAGAFTPAIRQRHGVARGLRPGRSMKAGAFTPAIRFLPPCILVFAGIAQ